LTGENARATREIFHGQLLARQDPESIWGWKTPAGRLRATQRAARIAAGACLGPGVRALELGCGTGVFTEMFAQTGADITAIDISEDLLDQARARQLDPERVRFVACRIEDVSDAGRFDAVIGSSVLHHLDVEAAVARMRVLLRSGGLVSFAEPNMLNPQVFAERHARFLPVFDYVSPDETAFVRWSLARLLKSHRFDEIAITPLDWLHPATPPPLIGLVSRTGALLERLPIIREFGGSIYIRCRRGRSS
jgi:SAM-dependent methyltransferase